MDNRQKNYFKIRELILDLIYILSKASGYSVFIFYY
jgi:hypothetical protein